MSLWGRPGRPIGRRAVLFGAAALGVFLLGFSKAILQADATMTARTRRNKSGEFRNTYPHEAHGFLAFLKWRWQRFIEPPSAATVAHAGEPRVPVLPVDAAYLRENRAETTLTWVGHATLLVQFQGRNILTDPHFGELAGPTPLLAFPRTVPPAMTLEELPPLDLVVISHNHYDHLDRESVQRLARLQPGLRFYVPLGLQAWFAEAGIVNVTELDWWEREQLDGLTVRAVPVQHFSSRTPFDRNRTLWAGWVVEAEGFRFFFAGDTGYSPDFADIHRRLGPMELAAIPIGAYAPRWFMRAMHVDPAEAVQVHQDLAARHSVAMHWGTFRLTDEPLDEPPRLLAEALRAKGIPAERFLVMRHGETRRLDARAGRWAVRQPGGATGPEQLAPEPVAGAPGPFPLGVPAAGGR
ncbi:MAG: MBL fold metallo-hydrolase [Candidatus Lambdaproteobacteria bacterium]|nr:MBL fold metallo-hydrolase [Candidatus Lambdaproteobacteria bacterium]